MLNFGTPGLKRFKLGLGGNTEYLFAAALGLVIVVSLVLVIYQSVGGGGGPVGSSDMMYKCIKPGCGHETPVKMEDIPREAHERASDPGMIRLDCPQCGGKESMLRMMECPKCKKPYVPQTVERMDEIMRGASDIRDVCPHCGTDKNDYLREQIQNR